MCFVSARTTATTRPGASTAWQTEIERDENTGSEYREARQDINCLKRKLDTIAYSRPPGQPRWCRLLGHPVLPQGPQSDSPKVCPQCLREKGSLRRHWDLALMVACPVHQCSLASSCPECGVVYVWFRRGLLELRCGVTVRCDCPRYRMLSKSGRHHPKKCYVFSIRREQSMSLPRIN